MCGSISTTAIFRQRYHETMLDLPAKTFVDTGLLGVKLFSTLFGGWLCWVLVQQEADVGGGVVPICITVGTSFMGVSALFGALSASVDALLVCNRIREGTPDSLVPQCESPTFYYNKEIPRKTQSRITQWRVAVIQQSQPLDAPPLPHPTTKATQELAELPQSLGSHIPQAPNGSHIPQAPNTVGMSENVGAANPERNLGGVIGDPDHVKPPPLPPPPDKPPPAPPPPDYEREESHQAVPPADPPVPPDHAPDPTSTRSLTRSRQSRGGTPTKESPAPPPQEDTRAPTPKSTKSNRSSKTNKSKKLANRS